MRLRDRGSQRGAGLVLIIGIIAALAVMASSVVILSGNVQHNTYRDRMQKTAFNVAEAAMDAGMYMLAFEWPFTASHVQPDFDEDAFRDQYPEDEFPAPENGEPFVTVQYYDNPMSVAAGVPSTPLPPDPSVTWDANGDNQLWLVAQVGVGPSTTRIQSLVEVDFLESRLPRGIALFSEGDIDSSGVGGGVMPKVAVEVPPSSGDATSVYAGGVIAPADVIASNIVGFAGTTKTLEDIFPTTLVDTLAIIAEKHGRYFETVDEALASPVDPIYSPQGGVSGLTVINAAPAETVRITANTVVNSEEHPGLLMVLGGGQLELRGNMHYYGTIFCEGVVSTAAGTPTVHGMLLTMATADLNGTCNVLYNDRCIVEIDDEYPDLVQQVPNTWREIQPVFD